MFCQVCRKSRRRRPLRGALDLRISTPSRRLVNISLRTQKCPRLGQSFIRSQCAASQSGNPSQDQPRPPDSPVMNSAAGVSLWLGFSCVRRPVRVAISITSAAEYAIPKLVRRNNEILRTSVQQSISGRRYAMAHGESKQYIPMFLRRASGRVTPEITTGVPYRSEALWQSPDRYSAGT
jgi:hypothetical protein